MRKSSSERVVSEAAAKTRRLGRPRALPKEKLDPHVGRRQGQDRLYAQRAVKRMGTDLGASYAVLAELGRLKNSETFKRAVAWYWTEGYYLSSKVASTNLRRMRTGKVATPATPYPALARVVDEYLACHPGEYHLTLHALDLLKEGVRRDRSAL